MSGELLPLITFFGEIITGELNTETLVKFAYLARNLELIDRNVYSFYDKFHGKPEVSLAKRGKAHFILL